MTDTKNVMILNYKNEFMGNAEASQEGKAIALQHLVYMKVDGNQVISPVFSEMTEAEKQSVDFDLIENPMNIKIAIPVTVKLELPKIKRGRHF